MTRTSTRREFVQATAAMALGCKSTPENSALGPLVVGGLPVTCNLIQAAYMLAPLVMDLSTKKIPVKIVALGHRSGSVIMVRKDSSYRKFQELAGKRIAIPSRFAVDLLFLRKMLKHESMTVDQVELIERPPPEMPAALYAKAVDAYCTGEPFGAAAQKAGYAVPLRMTRDEWRNYICCVLTVREELIQGAPELMQLSIDAGTLKAPVPYERYVTEKFAKAATAHEVRL
jgi:NitT/TauT family transport system substrate-binding protein